MQVWLPWSMLYAAIYGEAKKHAALRLGCEEAHLPAAAIVAASAGAAGFAGFLTHPLDVVKTRLQVRMAFPGCCQSTLAGTGGLPWMLSKPACR